MIPLGYHTDSAVDWLPHWAGTGMHPHLIFDNRQETMSFSSTSLKASLRSRAVVLDSFTCPGRHFKRYQWRWMVLFVSGMQLIFLTATSTFSFTVPGYLRRCNVGCCAAVYETPWPTLYGAYHSMRKTV